MLRRHTLLKVNIREQLPRPYIRAPHSCLPQIAQTTNHIRNSLSGHFFSSLLGRSGAGSQHKKAATVPQRVLEANWSLGMALAWISFRTEQAVRNIKDGRRPRNQAA